MTSTSNNMFRTTLIGFCVLLSSVAIWAAVPLDKVVAVVNSSVLTQNQVDQTAEEIKQQLQATNQPLPAPAVLRQKALDKAIGEQLQLQVAERAKISVSDADVTRAINSIAQQNHLSLEQLKETIQKQGFTFSTYRTQIHNQMVMQHVQQQAIGNKVQVSQAEAQAYLKKAANVVNNQTAYRLDDLLIPLDASATPAETALATKQAEALLRQARSGTSFNQLAKPPVQRTDLQWRAAQDLPSMFVSAVSHLKIGDITGPIKAPNGLHILRLVDARGQTALTEAEAKQKVWQQKMQQEVEKWTAELRKSAYVKVM